MRRCSIRHQQMKQIVTAHVLDRAKRHVEVSLPV
jgi:hypothetical protein